MTTWRSYPKQLAETLRYYALGLYRQLGQKNVFLWAQAIAFKVLVTVVPVIILATGILGQVLQREKPFDTIAAFISNFVPPDQSSQLIVFLRQLSSAGDFFTIVGVFGLLFSAMTLFTTLRVALGNVFQEEWHENRSILGGYLFDLRMVIQVGLVFLLTIGLSIFVQALNTAGSEMMGRVGLDYVWVRVGWGRVFTMLGLIIPFLLTTVMFFQLLYFVPKPRPPRSSVLLGASVSALLWEATKYGFTLYATHVGRFDRYSGTPEGDGGLSKLGDTFGLIIAFVFWVYFSGIILCLGAILTLLYEKRHRARRVGMLTEAMLPSEATVPDTATEPAQPSCPPAAHLRNLPPAPGEPIGAPARPPLLEPTPKAHQSGSSSLEIRSQA